MAAPLFLSSVYSIKLRIKCTLSSMDLPGMGRISTSRRNLRKNDDADRPRSFYSWRR